MTPEEYAAAQRQEAAHARMTQEHQSHPLSCACRQCGRDQLDRNDRW